MDWTRGAVIGRGSSATVSLAVSPSGTLFAVKTINSAPSSESNPMQNEQSILSTLSSPYIVAYKGHENSQGSYNLFMEYVPGGTLANVAGKLAEPTIGFYTWRILMGLEHLHSNGIVHCDIKPRNILIGSDGPKIADLGCARAAKSACGVSGTPMYMAPEAARGEEQGFAADVWAVGCTVAEMASGSPPWTGGPAAALFRIGSSAESPAIPAWLSEEARDFLGRCLRRNCGERWRVEELLRHPFVQRYSRAGDEIEGEVRESKDWIFSSPTSVLEQGIWNFDESFSSSLSLCFEVGGRIGELAVGDGEARWEVEEDWITIRV